MSARETWANPPQKAHKDGDACCDLEAPLTCAECGADFNLGYWRGGKRVCWGCWTKTRAGYLDYLRRWGPKK